MLALAMVRLLWDHESYESVPKLPRVSILYAVVLALQLLLYSVMEYFKLDYMLIQIRRIERFSSNWMARYKVINLRDLVELLMLPMNEGCDRLRSFKQNQLSSLPGRPRPPSSTLPCD